MPLCLFSQYKLIEPELVTKLADSKFNDQMPIHHHKGKIYFTQFIHENNAELWSTDGTQDGTKQLTYLNSFSGAYPSIFENRLDKLIFSANGEKDRGLWSTDGTKEGTYFLDSIFLRIRTEYRTNYRLENVLIDNKVFFIAMRHPFGSEPWISDGTREGTFMLKDINESGGIHCNYIYKLDNRIVFLADFLDSTKSELWSTDGTKKGTFKLLDFFHPSFENYEKYYPLKNYVFSELNGKLIFTNRMDGFGNCIWVTDGTKEGTELITDTTQSESGYIYLNAVVNEKSYFITRDSAGTHSLWVSDGKKVNTKKTLDLIVDDEYNDEFYNRIKYLVPMGDKLAIAHPHRKFLWFTDSYTLSKFEYEVAYDYARMNDVISINDGIMFREYKKGSARPWISDGTEDGTFKVEGFEYGNDETSFLNFEYLFNNVSIVQALKDNSRSLMKIDLDTKEVSTLISHIDKGFDTSFLFGEIIDSTLFFKVNVMNLKKHILNSQLWQIDPIDNSLALIAPNMDEITVTANNIGTIMSKSDDGYLYFYADYESTGSAIWRVKSVSKDSVINKDTIPEPDTDLVFEMYPNPASDLIKLKLSKPTHLFIVNLLGQKIMDLGIVKEENVNVTALYPGVYFITDDKWMKLKNFVKE